MASKEQQIFAEGDWIKHPYHGVGQITGLEQKTLGGEEKTFYRVDTDDSTYWIPIEDADESAARLVVSEESLKKSLEILSEEPEIMADHYRARRGRIREVRESGRLTRVAKLVRDLAGRRHRESLNSTERRAYREFRQSLIAEWARVEGISKEKAESRLRKFLGISREKTKSEETTAIDPLGNKK
jgi:CarD family transcriptional regulator